VSVRYVVKDGDAGTVGELLAGHAAPASAVAEGRVFVGDKRVTDATRAVKPGDEIVVEEGRGAAAPVRIVSEFRDLYAVAKPAGLSTEPDRSGTQSVVHAVAELLRGPPNVFHAATRLDASVSGLVVIARGAEAARFAASLKAEGRLSRRYLAVAGRAPLPAAGAWDVSVDARGRGRDAQKALSMYATLAVAPALPSGSAPVLLAVEPVTGRTHQIRLHAEAAGAPLLGDVKHGGLRRVVLRNGRALPVDRVALHATRIQVDENDETVWTAVDPFPDDLRALWAALEGDAAAPDAALSLPPLYVR
jgi:23S rRNA-/tRNA-specific pseudouridylate synthase